jgi:hypothetical protein
VILFFGCRNESKGHYLFDRRMDTPRYPDPEGHGFLQGFRIIPWNVNIDSGLAPRTSSKSEAPNGVAGFHQNVAWVGAPGEVVWSALAWWDNSVDTRPGSNCAFLVDRRCTPAELLAEARAAFPQIFARFKYEVVLPGGRL